MDDSDLRAGARGAHYEDDAGEAQAMEDGVNALGTPAAGAGPGAADIESPSAGLAPRVAEGAPPVHLASDAGAQPGLEQGVRLTEEGAQAGGGETF